MFNAKPSGTETLDFVIGQDFRQVGLIKNPQETLRDMVVMEFQHLQHQLVVH